MTGSSKERIVELVLLRAKAGLIVLIVLAVLYVLISPLPEMAAAKSGQSLAVLSPSLLCFLLLLLDLLLPPFSRERSVIRGAMSRSLLCTRLC